MRFNKSVQIGLLLSLYLTRAGRARLKDVSENLMIPLNFLEQVARTLRAQGLLKSYRGPGGGYELNPNATVFSVIAAFTTVTPLSKEQYLKYKNGAPEMRALAKFAREYYIPISVSLDRKFNDIMSDLVGGEVELMNTLDSKGIQN